MALKELLEYTRAHPYIQNGKYKGIRIMDSHFLKNLPQFSISDLTSANVETTAVKSLMLNSIHETNTKLYMLKIRYPCILLLQVQHK